MDRLIRRFRRHNILNPGSPGALSQIPGALGWELQMTVPRRPRMTIQAKLLCAVAVSGFVAFAATSPVQALTTQECSAKYQAAKTAGTLAGQKWNDFRKANCGADATATPAAAPAAAPAPAPAPKEAKKEAAPAAAPAAPSGPAVFPSAVDPKYAKETAGKGRMHTCVDQYNANKATNGNGGMKWIEKGGGYYSECNKKLKPAA
jgi:pyruvate/2-oxoglutarate dehydrogenase complex dihydrolipoamide acyltransferase (E2) component